MLINGCIERFSFNSDPIKENSSIRSKLRGLLFFPKLYLCSTAVYHMQKAFKNRNFLSLQNLDISKTIRWICSTETITKLVNIDEYSSSKEYLGIAAWGFTAYVIYGMLCKKRMWPTVAEGLSLIFSAAAVLPAVIYFKGDPNNIVKAVLFAWGVKLVCSQIVNIFRSEKCLYTWSISENKEINLLKKGARVQYQLVDRETGESYRGPVNCGGREIEEVLSYYINCELVPGEELKINSTSKADRDVIIDEDNWAVTLICVGIKDKLYGHAEIAVEGVDERGKNFIRIAHLKMPKTSSDRGDVLLHPVEDFDWDKKAITWTRSKDKVNKMLKRITLERDKKIPVFFCLSGSESIFASSVEIKEKGTSPQLVDPDNCLTWAVKKLEIADIEYSLSIGRKLFAMPVAEI